MPVYRIDNPSDQYHFEAPSRLVAALVVYSLGRGMYGATELAEPSEKDHQPWSSPIVFGWSKEYFKDELGWNPDEPLPIEQRRQIVESLRSVTIGPLFEFRFAQTLPAAERYKRHDKNRSSMNDIRKSAVSIAAQLEDQIGKTSTNEDEPIAKQETLKERPASDSAAAMACRDYPV